jgi:hypothetical protein
MAIDLPGHEEDRTRLLMALRQGRLKSSSGCSSDKFLGLPTSDEAGQ